MSNANYIVFLLLPLLCYSCYMSLSRHLDQKTAYGTAPMRKQGSEWLFLLVENNEGYWGFPKGHQEDGEDVRQTAARETCEETGICISTDKLDESFAYGYDIELPGGTQEKTVTLFPFMCSDETINLQTEEIRSYTWADSEKALELIGLPVEPFLREVEEYAESLAPK